MPTRAPVPDIRWTEAIGVGLDRVLGNTSAQGHGRGLPGLDTVIALLGLGLKARYDEEYDAYIVFWWNDICDHTWALSMSADATCRVMHEQSCPDTNLELSSDDFEWILIGT